jgi:hypothetical protein
MSMNIKEIKISKYANTFSKTNEEVLLIDELDKIKSGFYKDLVNDCREKLRDNDKLGYQHKKKELPAVTFSGSFANAHKKDNLKDYSRLIVVDIDNIGWGINEIKQKLVDDKHIIAVWISPSGTGLKCLISTSQSQDYHKDAFDQILEYFKAYYNIDIDKTGSDLCRLCYVSYDENIKINASFEPFIVDISITSTTKKPKEMEACTIPFTSNVTFNKLNAFSNRRLIEKIIKFLRTRNISITEEYDNWYRVALAIANSFTFDVGQRYFLQLSGLDKNFDEYKCLQLLEYCYRNKRGTISFKTITHLAKQKGFIV